MNRTLTSLIASFGLIADQADAQAPAASVAPVTHAGTGESISVPTSRATSSVTDHGRTVAVPLGMVYVPGGSAPIGEGAASRTVAIDPFCIGKFSVTNAEYQVFLAATGTRSPRYWLNGTWPEGKANHPVAYVSLLDARAYAAWVSQSTGWTVAIPTADQWEKAARGPRGTLYPWGNSPDTRYEGEKLTTRFNYNALMVAPLLTDEPHREVTYSGSRSKLAGTKTTVDRIAAIDANGRSTTLAITPTGSVRGWISHATNTGFTGTDLFRVSNARGGNTTPVGSFEDGKSGYGAYDMAGNIWNWTETEIVARNGVEKGQKVREIRGGSWYSPARSCRATTIGEGRGPNGHFNTVGFRIIMIPPAASQ